MDSVCNYYNSDNSASKASSDNSDVISFWRRAFSLSKAKTKKDLIHEALTEFIRHKKRKDLTELAGRIRFRKNYDYKSMRALKG